MKIIGLTGGIACGKSTVSGMLAKLGVPIVDADAISHALTQANGEALPLLFQTFGEGIRHPDGTLDRKALSAIVFAHPDKRQTLNALMHPLIEAKMKDQIDRCRQMQSSIVVLDVPLLFEANMTHLVDKIVCVSASKETQIERIALRDGLHRDDAVRRIESQWDHATKEARSDVVLSTEGSLTELENTIATLYQSWCNAPN